ncbi:hypothetical protein L6R50_10840 [Myxococcota bacterium]|nr:hypothetical protein [Myxococcota bacterium]
MDCGQLSLDYANGYLQYLIPGGFMMVIGGTIATSGVIALLVSLGRDHDRRTLVYPRIGPGHIGLGVTSRF